MKQAITLCLLSCCLIPGLLISTEVKNPQNIQQDSHHAPYNNATPSPPQEAPSSHNALSANSLYQLIAAEMALSREQPEAALSNYIAAAQETQDAYIAERATQIALTLASLEVAIEPAQIWAQASPENLEAQITTAAILIRLHKTEAAIPYLRLAETQNPEEAFQYFLLLYQQLQQEKESQAFVDTLQRLTKAQKNALAAPLALCEIYLYHGEKERALELAHSVVTAHPHSVIAIQLYTEALNQSKGKENAKAFLDQKITQTQNHSSKTPAQDTLLKQYYTQFLIGAGYHDEARTQMYQLLKKANLDAQSLLQLARTAIQAQWFDLAEKALSKSSQFEETKDLSYYFLARVEEMKDNTHQAISWFKRVLSGPFHVLSQIRASILLAEQEKYKAALEALSQAQPTDDTEAKQILLTKVEILNKAKRYKESLAVLENPIKIVPSDTDFLYARSLVATRLNQLDVAESDLRTVLAIQPEHVEALNHLGYLLIHHAARYTEAQPYLTLALQLSPNNPTVLDNLGWLYYKTGEYRQSIEMLKKASELTTDAEIAAHLGEVLWQNKNFDAAKQVWETALEHSPKHEGVMQTMQRFMPKLYPSRLEFRQSAQ